MLWHPFAIRLGLALILGALIGAERQWRQRMAGLRTNALVAAGAAMFVMLSALAAHPDDSFRIAGQVVSGIGFLGAGVILRNGLNITGLNTAATLCVRRRSGRSRVMACTDPRSPARSPSSRQTFASARLGKRSIVERALQTPTLPISFGSLPGPIKKRTYERSCFTPWVGSLWLFASRK